MRLEYHDDDFHIVPETSFEAVYLRDNWGDRKVILRFIDDTHEMKVNDLVDFCGIRMFKEKEDGQ